MNNSKIAIIVVTYNSAEYIGDCLSSLAGVDYPADQFELVIVDNASTDATLEIIKNNYTNLRIFPLAKNVGFASGCNVGINYAVEAGYDYVYLLNPDTVVTPNFLKPVVALAQTDSKIGAVQSKLLLHSDQSKINSVGNEIHYLGFGYAGGHQTLDNINQIKEVTYPSGAAVLLNSQALKAVGYFNDSLFMYHEDLDLGWRLWLQGFKCVLEPGSVVYHKYDFSRSISKYYYMERNREIIALQNYKWATLIILAPAWLAMELGLLMFSLISGFWKEKFRAYGYFFNLGNIKKILKSRRQVQSSRTVGDRQVIKRFTGRILFQDISNPVLTYIANPVFNLYWQIVKTLIWW